MNYYPNYNEQLPSILTSYFLPWINDSDTRLPPKQLATEAINSLLSEAFKGNDKRFEKTYSTFADSVTSVFKLDSYQVSVFHLQLLNPLTNVFMCWCLVI